MRKRISIMAILLAGSVAAANETTSYSPAVEKRHPKQVYWGDTHLHTSWSADANLFGNINVDPATAYRFARGEPVTASNGMTAQLDRPLDFLVVADHAEYLGVVNRIRAEDPALSTVPTVQRWQKMLRNGGAETDKAYLEIVLVGFQGKGRIAEIDRLQASIWQSAVHMAEEANQPGIFTTLAGFEWSSSPQGNNMHRVVVFADDSDKVTQVVPFGATDSDDPEALWEYLADYERKTGGRVLAIPHNGNLSNGMMFVETNLMGEPIDSDYAERRALWEPLVEVVQGKGAGETHPLLSPNDEFADYGIWDKSNVSLTKPKEPWMLQYEYARSALRRGLQLAEKTGVNPYQFGMIGSTDTHTGLAAADSSNYWGKSTNQEPSSTRATDVFSESPFAENAFKIYNWEELAAGYAAVWATENTRQAIFDAMRRREVYASTGPRITVRFFGGWSFESSDVFRPDYAAVGYDKGVPMGGVLPSAPENIDSPSFMIAVQKDPMGANLDRIQIIKGWLDADGQTQEKIFDIAWSDNRKPGPDQRLPQVGSTVDLENASYQNTIGAAQLAAVWRDPDFDLRQRAFYYVRVLEIPTPHWVVYDKARLDAKIPANAKQVHQERAYTSPIWYEPSQN